MSKILLVLPLLAFVAYGQGVDGWITQALDKRLGPIKRLELLDQIIKAGGVDALARRGLDPNLDAEVVHAVVDKLFATDNAVAYIEPIIRLLLSDNEALREKIARRIQQAAEEPATAKKLQDPLDKIANAEVTDKAHKDAQLRIAAVRALRQIPQRKAVRSIVNAWQHDEDETVQAECKTALANVLVPRTAEAANAYLNDNSHLTYRDLRDKVFEAQRKRIIELGKFQIAALKHADAKRCFEVLSGGTEEGRQIAAERLTTLVKQRQFGMKPDEFVTKALAAFARARDRDLDPVVAAGVIRVLKELMQGGDKAPLRGEKAREDLFKALRPLTQKGPKWNHASLAAVDLLGSLVVPAARHLVAFARDSEKNPDVRKAAVNKLGSLARLGTEEREFVGDALAKLLEQEKAPEVRRQILFTLKSAPVETAIGPIQALIKSNREKPGAISDSEVEYCIEILRQLASEAAFNELLAQSKKPTKEAFRIYAIREGLLMRKTTADEEKEILATLEAMALAADESPALKKAIVVALGERGTGAAYPLLRKFGADAALAGDAAVAIRALVERFAKTPKGVEIAMQAVRDRALDGEALDKLIRAIIATCENAKPPRGAADMRYRRAILFHEKHKDSEDEQVRADLARLLKETVKLAEKDGLTKDLHADACERYKTLLLLGGQTPENQRDAIDCLVTLAKLAGEEKAKAAAHYLEATDIAVKLKDRATAEMLYTKAKESGAEATALAKLDERIKALPSAG